MFCLLYLFQVKISVIKRQCWKFDLRNVRHFFIDLKDLSLILKIYLAKLS